MRVNKGRLLHETVARLDKLNAGEAVLLQPYKKDRFVCIVALEREYYVLERGFEQKEFVVEAGKVGKLLKTLCRKEFPRSNKVWLNHLTREKLKEFLQVLQYSEVRVA